LSAIQNLANLSQEKKNAMEFEKLLCAARFKLRGLKRKGADKFEFNKYLETIRPDVAQHIRDVMNSKRLRDE